MSNVKIKLDHSGVAELMKSEGMRAVLTEHAGAVRNAAGDGYEQDIYVGKNRANAMVRAATFKARRDNLKNNTLLRAISK